MTLDELRQVLDHAVVEVPAAELPGLIGVLAAMQAKALARLTTPAPIAPPNAEWVTAAEVARRFKLAVSTINELSRLGRLPHRMFGRYRRFSLPELLASGLDSKTAEHGTANR